MITLPLNASRLSFTLVVLVGVTTASVPPLFDLAPQASKAKTTVAVKTRAPKRLKQVE
jgi:hypothetical protein